MVKRRKRRIGFRINPVIDRFINDVTSLHGTLYFDNTLQLLNIIDSSIRIEILCSLPRNKSNSLSYIIDCRSEWRKMLTGSVFSKSPPLLGID